MGVEGIGARVARKEDKRFITGRGRYTDDMVVPNMHFAAFALVAYKGDIYYGLWYPIIIALLTFVIGLLFVRETKDRNIYADD